METKATLETKNTWWSLAGGLHFHVIQRNMKQLSSKVWSTLTSDLPFQVSLYHHSN